MFLFKILDFTQYRSNLVVLFLKQDWDTWIIYPEQFTTYIDSFTRLKDFLFGIVSQMPESVKIKEKGINMTLLVENLATVDWLQQGYKQKSEKAPKFFCDLAGFYKSKSFYYSFFFVYWKKMQRTHWSWGCSDGDVWR